MHSQHHPGGVYQVDEGKTVEIVHDPCLQDRDYQVQSDETSGNYSQNSAGGAPKSFT